jgi:rhamnogalacturonyl hydrolase YesR
MSDSSPNPVGTFDAELLLLAPEENPDDGNLFSLVSQLLELGIRFVLDEHGRVPTRPPKELAAYKACLFPEPARAKYDAALDDYYRRGGFLCFDKYYPTAAQTSQAGFTSTTASYLHMAWGRDLYFYSLASYLLEAGVTLNEPRFRHALEQRSTQQMLDECRGAFLTKARAHKGPWRDWGDPAWTQFLANLAAARVRKDDEWLHAVDRCLGCVCDAAEEAFRDPLRFQELPIAGAANNSFENMGHVLMKRGAQTGDHSFIETGAELAWYFAEHVFEQRGGTILDRRGVLWYNGESIQGLPALYWLAPCTGQRSYAELANRLTRTAIEKTQRPDGLWHHWVNLTNGTKGSCWSRAQMWPILFFTESLEALDPKSESAQRIHDSSRKTFEALRTVQDPDWGLWHLLADEPDSRIESSATAGILYCHDRLREMGVLDDRYEEMCHRAFVGLKRLYYRGGLGACCRGTACGDANYYRSRPQGYNNRTLYLAALATRAAAVADTTEAE